VQQSSGLIKGQRGGEAEEKEERKKGEGKRERFFQIAMEIVDSEEKEAQKGGGKERTADCCTIFLQLYGILF